MALPTKIPPRDWRRWWWAYAAHFCTGLLAALCGYWLSPVFLAISGIVCVRQVAEFLRRHDTPGRDLGDHLTGFVVGTLIILGYVVWPPSGWLWPLCGIG